MRDRQRDVKDPEKMRGSDPWIASQCGAAPSRAWQTERERTRQGGVDSEEAPSWRELKHDDTDSYGPSWPSDMEEHVFKRC